jgi:hypothetical protein
MAVPGAVLPRIASPTAAQRGSVVLAIRRAREAKIYNPLDRDPRPDGQASRHPHPLLHSHGVGRPAFSFTTARWCRINPPRSGLIATPNVTGAWWIRITVQLPSCPMALALPRIL